MRNSLKSFAVACIATIALGVQSNMAKTITQSINLNKSLGLEQQHSLTIIENKDVKQDSLIGEILQPQGLSIQLGKPVIINATAKAVELLAPSSESESETETATDSIEAADKMAQPTEPKGETPVAKHETPAVSISGEEKELLARLVEAEAKGEPYEGKVAVATIVLNRVESPQFPNTVTEVINEVVGHAYAFTPVQNGAINNPASAESTQAVEEALKREDTLNDSIFFYNPKIATDQWIRSRQIVKKIGNHVFAI
ncbi:spore cortex-lytic protein [Pueribacillus theae]|uniref:Spore cortex-lytic protein n=1 Tax=Pueribacillus theae TaxID=2171751 RepID=A0A2U1JT75_9BACI|nr:cell wall hydrolase [Pueribacillus theae]PWA08410.1 spore cortex-lytic protein [Pueribacillus theae]